MKHNSNPLALLVALVLVSSFTIALLWLLQSHFDIDLQWSVLFSLFGIAVQLEDITGKVRYFVNGSAIHKISDLYPLAKRIEIENSLSASRMYRDRGIEWIEFSDSLSYAYQPAEHVSLAMYKSLQRMGKWQLDDIAAFRLVLDRLVQTTNERHYKVRGSMGGFAMNQDHKEFVSYHNSRPWIVKVWCKRDNHFTCHLSDGRKIRLPYFAENITDDIYQTYGKQYE